MTANILIFDSGVGGLSIAREIHQSLANKRLIYCSDNGFFPYGTKTEDELVERVERVLRALVAIESVDLAVIACNTASTLALPHIRSHFDIPIVGVVPAIKPAAERSSSGHIGLLATPGTVSRSYTHQLIEDFASHCQVQLVGSAELVLLAERKLRGQNISDEDLSPILKQFDDAQIDTLVLACTHFPLLRDEIKHWFSRRQRALELIDSGAAIARRVEYLLRHSKNLESPHTPATQASCYYFTSDNQHLQPQQGQLDTFGFSEYRLLALG